MRKKITLVLVMCICLCMQASATYASIGETVGIDDDAATVSLAANVDLWNTQGTRTLNNTSILVWPNLGDKMKLHFYVYSGSIEIRVLAHTTGYMKNVTTWNTTGHHWCDLINGTDGGPYTVYFNGTAVVDGGIYIEN